MNIEIIASFFVIILLDLVINSDFVLQLRANIRTSNNKSKKNPRFEYLKAYFYSALFFLIFSLIFIFRKNFYLLGFSVDLAKIIYLILAIYIFSKNYIVAMEIYNLKIYELNNKKINQTLSDFEIKFHYYTLVIFVATERIAIGYAVAEDFWLIALSFMTSFVLFNIFPKYIIIYIAKFYRLKLISIVFSIFICSNLIAKIFNYPIPSIDLFKIIFFTFICELISIFFSKNHRKNSLKKA